MAGSVWYRDRGVPVCGGAMVVGEIPPDCVCEGRWFRGDPCPCSAPANPPEVYIAEADYPGGAFVAPFGESCYQFDEANSTEQLPGGAVVIPAPSVLFEECAPCCGVAHPDCCDNPLGLRCHWLLNATNSLTIEWAFRLIGKQCCPIFPGGPYGALITTFDAPFFGEQSWPVDVSDSVPLYECSPQQRETIQTVSAAETICGNITAIKDYNARIRVTARSGQGAEVGGFSLSISPIGPGSFYTATDTRLCGYGNFEFDHCIQQSLPSACGVFCELRIVGYVRAYATRIQCPGSHAALSGPEGGQSQGFFPGCSGCGDAGTGGLVI